MHTIPRACALLLSASLLAGAGRAAAEKRIPFRYKMAMAHLPVGAGWRQVAPATEEGFAAIKAAGFNTVGLSWSPYRISSDKRWWEAPDALEQIKKAVAAARKQKLTVFLWEHLGLNTADILDVGQSKTVNAAGVAGRAACPVDPDFWGMYLTPIGAALAALPGVDGILLEPEVYAGGEYDREQSCYCERCLRRFGEAKALQEWAVPEPAQRKAFVDKSGLAKAFMEWQEGEVRAHAVAYRKAAQAANEKLRLGYYIGPTSTENWYHRALAQGLYDGRQPLVNMDQRTYYGIGINWDRGGTRHTLWDWAAFERGIFEAWNVPAEVMHGVYLDTTATNFSPKEIERFCFIAGMAGGGYWIWNESREPTQFYQAYRSAAAKVDQALADPKDFLLQAERWITIRKEEGFDTAWSEGLMARAREALAKGDAAMATVWAFQAQWSLGR